MPLNGCPLNKKPHESGVFVLYFVSSYADDISTAF